MQTPSFVVSLLCLSVFSTLPAAASDQLATCLFGEDTTALWDSEVENVERLKALGLTLGSKKQPRSISELPDPFERALIATMVVDEAQSAGVDLPYESDEELYAAFLEMDGYIRRVDGNYGEFKGFIVVAYYPGENEYGRIYGVKEFRREKFRFEVVAHITDGFFERCTLKH